MNKYIILIFIFLSEISLFNSYIYYRPMSKSSIDFGQDVCYYQDISDNSKLMYVKGCPIDTSCKHVEVDTETTVNEEYLIRTCQPRASSFSKRGFNEDCDPGLYECDSSLYECKPNGNGKCSYISTTPGDGGTSCASLIFQSVNGGTQSCVPQTESSSIGNLCYKKTNTEEIVYSHYTNENGSKICKKLNLEQTGPNTGIYQIKTKELVAGLYSIPDGEYVDDTSDGTTTSNDYCQNGFSLYFFGNGKQILTSDSRMFKQCVTVLDFYSFTESGSSTTSYLIKYKINNGDEHIYDTSKLSNDSPTEYKNKQNQEIKDYLTWPRIELLKNMIEEYKAQNRPSNKYLKWKYLHQNPKYYLLYKDQPEVLDYLIQNNGYSDYIPEGISDQTPNGDNTQPTTDEAGAEPTETNDTTTEEPSKQSSCFLNIQYLIILLFLFLF